MDASNIVRCSEEKNPSVRGFLIENVVLAYLKLKGLPGHEKSTVPSHVSSFGAGIESASFVRDTSNRLYVPLIERYPVIDAVLVTYEYSGKASGAVAEAEVEFAEPDQESSEQSKATTKKKPIRRATSAHVRFIQIKSGGIKPKSEMDLRAMLADGSAGRALWGGAVPARMKKVRYSVVWIATSAELAKLRRKSEAEEFISLGRIDAKLDK